VVEDYYDCPSALIGLLLVTEAAGSMAMAARRRPAAAARAVDAAGWRLGRIRRRDQLAFGIATIDP